MKKFTILLIAISIIAFASYSFYKAQTKNKLSICAKYSVVVNKQGEISECEQHSNCKIINGPSMCSPDGKICTADEVFKCVEK